jgi:hypothetical protein
LVTAEIYHKVRGYDEMFEGWGGEDRDFYTRCAEVAKDCLYSDALLEPIKHSHEERVRFYDTKSIGESDARNQALTQSRQGVNPGGYGVGGFEIHCGWQSTRLLPTWRGNTRVPRPVRRPPLATAVQ